MRIVDDPNEVHVQTLTKNELRKYR